VPVIKHADEKSIKGIAREINELALKARNKQLPVLLTVNVPPDISSCDNCLFLALSASSFISRAIPLNINISIAVADEDKLYVPVIKHADEKSIKGIAREMIYNSH
jgi:pyruvate/2-oxoglutarate dehydrogenase complex dihydrolipoamide acyltransferase (E2) component